MTEQNAAYGQASELESFKNAGCTMPAFSEFYVPPTPEQVGQLIKAAGWSQRQVARLTGVSYNDKGSTTVRKWKTPKGKPEHREIPYSAWRLMLLAAGVVSISDDQAGL